jgi:2-hydroxymuconate-semialdehyde hydrolase
VTAADPEIGRSVRTGDLLTNYHDVGTGPPLLMLHGSGPGVSAWANWRATIPQLSPQFRVLAPDLAGFGYTRVPADIEYGRAVWLRQIVDLLDVLDVERTSVVGNSFGGGLALTLAIEHPERVDRLVLMGSVGAPFALTEGLDEVWGYEPSMEAMARLMRRTFAYDPALVTDDLVRMRFQASARPAAREAFSRMFPAPRQRWVDALAHDEEEVRAISHPTLLVHGRDDKVVPLSTTMTLLEWIDDSRAHIFGRCGHWTQIERADEFSALVAAFVGSACRQNPAPATHEDAHRPPA